MTLLKWIVVGLIGLVLLGGGCISLGTAWRYTRSTKCQSKLQRSQILGMLGSGLLTAAAVSGILFWVQIEYDTAKNETTWRDSIAVAPTLTGFFPDDHGVKEMTFSGKYLEYARLARKDLTGSYMNDTHLTKADLKGAKLIHVNLERADLYQAELQTATLDKAELAGADFTEAQLQGAKLGKAILGNGVKPELFDGATADANTCWPAKFFEDGWGAKVKALPTVGKNNKPLPPSKGMEEPNCRK